VAPPQAVLQAGVIPSSWTHLATLRMPSGLVGLDSAALLFGQGVMIDPSNGLFLSAPFAWTILDAAQPPRDGCPVHRVFHVDDDAPGDPGPGTPAWSNPRENGTAAAPYDAIQEAVDSAVDGDTILIHAGTYLGQGNTDIDLGGLALTVRSASGAAACRIMTPTTGFRLVHGETRATTIEGLTISGGTTGLVIDQRSAPTIRRCVISGHSRGGISCGPGTAPLLDACQILGNRNTTKPGGGLRLEVGSLPEIRSCLFAGNSSGYDGGAIYATTDLDLEGCTFADNWCSSGFGGAVAAYDHDAKFHHCVIWTRGTQTRQVWAGTAGVRFTFDFCDVQPYAISTVQPVTWGPGNLVVDPAFVNPFFGDYHLQSTSPCVDAGDPAFVPSAGQTDIDGQPRRNGAAVDLGADET
jgi:predicted outer membrane repeat protein